MDHFKVPEGMNSPSDDGQYTDSDREEGAIDDDRKSSEDSTSVERQIISCNSSDPSHHNIEMKKDGRNIHHLHLVMLGEEARLRQKLLERRNVLSSSSLLKREVIEVEHVGSSDDEEMFSIQPKESVVKQRNHFARSHEYRERERGGLTEKVRKPEKARDEKHWHKERKHEKHTHADYISRDYDSRETHKHHISGKHQQSREHESRLAGRVVLPESKSAQKPSSTKTSYKERENYNEFKTERLHHAKDANKGRSPRKREVNISPKRAGVALEAELPKNSGKKVPEAHAETHSNKFDKAISADEMHEEQPVISQKFDSDPEDEQEEKSEIKLPSMKDKTEIIVDSTSDAESDVILRDLDEDSMDLLEFDEEQMANFSPETRTRLEEEQQKRLITKLPVYYPGINGCRNVAEFECLNRIEEGTFGVVYHGKRKEGFPITSLREINMLLKAGNHPNIVNVQEIVIGSNMDKIYLVMEYVEHDMKSLMDTMYSRGKRFRTGEVKTLLYQLLSGIGDFGLSREFGDPLKPYTPIVVTLWYRAPELLLGVKEYSTAVDMWSCGCIFAEFIKLKPLFPGKGEMDQINKIFTSLLLLDRSKCNFLVGIWILLILITKCVGKKIEDLGTLNDNLWPGYSSLPGPRKTSFEHHDAGELEKKFPANLVDERGLEFIKELLTYDPAKRISAHEALTHDWFERYPPPTPPEMFPTWPAKSELGKLIVKTPITKSSSKEVQNAKLYKGLKVEPKKETSTSFALKFDVAPKFSK
ncbi:Serine/threonine-protein kinase PITSLRE [Dirofilaria immitis]|nr:Serine/threonine-protein kinase PITSLRE [Dirofilaria immitis]